MYMYVISSPRKSLLLCSLLQVSSLSGFSAVGVAEMIIKGLKEGHHHSLELFPKLVSSIASHKTISGHNQKGECVSSSFLGGFSPTVY